MEQVQAGLPGAAKATLAHGPQYFVSRRSRHQSCSQFPPIADLL